MALKNILYQIPPRNILHLNVKFSGDLLFRPLDENCVRRKCVKKKAPTLRDRRPAVGVRSLGSDSGIGSFGFSMCIPGHPTHTPFPLITTGATAVTRPPALK